MNPPNRDIAEVVLDRLMNVAFAASAEFREHGDAEGRALNLGVVMFFGAFMSAVTKWDDREAMCQAALGYSMRAADALERLRNRKDPQ